MKLPAAPEDYRAIARRRLPHFLYEYLDGGAGSEQTMRRNLGDLQSIALRQRVMVDVEDVDTSTSLFGKSWTMPVALAPVGLAGMYARRGEVQAAKAAAHAGVPFTLSTVSACPLREVAAATAEPFWLQLYMIRDRAFMADLLDQAVAANCSALVFTVDMPVPGIRYRDYRSGLAGASGFAGAARRFGQGMMRPRWAWDVGVRGRPHQLGNVARVLGGKSGMDDFFAWMRSNFDPSISWKDLEWVRGRWPGPLIVKGVLDPNDALEAIANGADGIVVSNHGGRQLDGAPSSAAVLPAIAEAVAGRTALLADGGVRSGADIVRMLALGADAVMIGRPWVYALAAAGERGVQHLLSLLKQELRVAMTLTGCARISEIGRRTIAGPLAER
ncbi:FMN-dependent L-lactate dehydrogenase LldD [Sphingomonas piscis]|uniref:FMN-dependent L-lactate dehydrogenase LldD n=1 Tax=Sphingomonas piscis TaxID=2714943 RepID=A0A6G7YNP4_9SPHN|nr:FMN-dependent L-lactate dehydrogenase LldD [Sphingomonas piscis]QIK78354.1 FMN-dependent L-lactate dehydrogenase LldD [Sphingomonas piscis]